MFFISQVKVIDDFFSEDNSFYIRSSIDNAVAKIVGAKDYETARVQFTMFCEDLQIVLKFVLGFLDHPAFKQLDKSEDLSQFKLLNKPLMAESFIHKYSEGIGAGLHIYFTKPDDSESEEHKQEREQQFLTINTYVDINKFKEHTAKLTHHGKHKKVLAKKNSELASTCQKIIKLYVNIQELRKFLIVSEIAGDKQLTASPQIIGDLAKAQINLTFDLLKIQTIIDGLSVNLDGPTYTIIMPHLNRHSAYFRRVQPVAEELITFVSKLSTKFPDKSILYVADQHLIKDNHYFLIREIILLCKNALDLIVKFPIITLDGDTASDKQKQKNLAKFNKKFPAAVADLNASLFAFRKATPVVFNGRSLHTDLAPPLKQITVICRSLKAEDLPVDDSIEVNLINDDLIVLAYAEISYYILILSEYLGCASESFKANRLFSRGDVDTGLIVLNKNKAIVKGNYTGLIKTLRGNTFAFENYFMLVKIHEVLTQEIDPQFIRITNKAFGLGKDVNKILAILKEIEMLEAKLASTNEDLKRFGVLLPGMMIEGHNLQEQYIDVPQLILSLSALADVTRKNISQLPDTMQQEVETLEIVIAEIEQLYAQCPAPNDANLFHMIQHNMMLIHSKVKKAQQMIQDFNKVFLEEEKKECGSENNFANNRFRLKLVNDVMPTVEIEETCQLVLQCHSRAGGNP